MKASFSLRLAYRHFQAGMGRVALSVVAVALGVALVVAIRLMNEAVLSSFMDTVDAVAGRTSFTVTAGEGFTFGEDLVERIAAVPDVELAVPLVRGVAFQDDGDGEILTVHGIDVLQDAAVRLYHAADREIDDLLEFLNSHDAIILGREFAERRGIPVGGVVRLVTPSGVHEFIVRGLLDPEGIASTLGGRLAVMDLYAAQRWFTADGQINQIDVVVRKDAPLATTKAAVATILPPGLRVEEPAVRKDVLRNTVAGFQAMMTAFSLIAVLAGFVTCYSRLGAIFEARTWEIGLIRAVGLRRLVVFVELLKESLLIGAAGTVLGIPLGVLIGQFGLPLAARTSAIAFRLPVSNAHAAIRPTVFALGAAVGITAAFLAATVPALRLARKQPVAALTMRGREAAPVARGLGEGVWVALVAATVVLLGWQYVTHDRTLGLITTGLVAGVACASAGLIVRYGGPLLTAVWGRMFGPTGELAAGHLSEQPRRASLTIATLGLGLAAVLMLGMIGWSFERTLTARLTESFQADMIVASAFAGGGYRGAPISDRLVSDLLAVPGVAAACGEQSVDVAFGDGMTILKSYDAVCVRDVRLHRFWLEDGAGPGALARVERGDAVLVSSAFAYQHGVKPGDTIRLDSPRGPLVMPVAGVANQPENAVTIVRERYRELWNDPRVIYVHVAVQESAQRDVVARAVTQRLGTTYRIQLYSCSQLVDYFAGQVRQAFSLQYPLQIVAFLLVLVGIGDTLATGVIERTRELGMMRAVGLRRWRLLEMVVLEGAGIAALGLVVAVGAGLALGAFWVAIQFPAMVGWKLDFHFPFRFALVAAAMSLLLCLAGSVLPAARAARLSVTKALRTE